MLRRRTTLPRGTRLAVVAALALLGAFQSPRATGAAVPRAASDVATYHVRIYPGSPRGVVTATLPAAAPMRPAIVVSSVWIDTLQQWHKKKESAI